MKKQDAADTLKDKSGGAGYAWPGGARKIAVTGLLTALTVVTTMFTKIPTPLIHGYFNLGDTVVLIAGVMFGGMTGAFVGAVGSAAADLFTGGFLFAPITLIVKGLEGYVAGRLSGADANPGAGAGLKTGEGACDGTGNGPGTGANAKGGARRVIGGGRLMPALCAGAIVMIAGYFAAEATVLTLFDRAFGLGAALTELPFNLVQGGVSVALARVAIEGLKRVKIFYRD